MKENRHKHTIWMDDDVWDQVESHYQKDNCAKRNEFIEKAIRNEVEVYRQYIEGEAVGYTLYEENDDDEPEEFDSCWGFFGYDVMRNGIADSILGLCEAIEKDEFATGKVRKETFVRKSFV